MSTGFMANSYLIELAPTPDTRRDQIIGMVNDRREYSERHFSGVRNHLPRLYDLWRGVFTGQHHPHKNNVHIPIIFSHVWADAARKVQASLGSYPIINLVGYGPGDKPIALKLEGLLNAQAKDAEVFIKELMTFVTGDLYGVAISQLMWDYTKEMRIINDFAELPVSGQIVKQIRKGEVVSFNGPNWESVDRLDAFIPPGIGRIAKMPWFIRRYFLDLDDVRLLAERGTFDKSELSRLEREGAYGENAIDEALSRRFQLRTGISDEEARWQDRYSRPIEINEYWGRVPSELAPDGVTQRVITVANRKYLLRNKPNPFNHGRLPFHAFSPMPDPHVFDAPGKAEVAEKLQIVANRYINQQLDATDFAIDPMMFYDRNRGLNTRNLISRPGRFLPVDGDPSKVVFPLQMNLAGINLGAMKVGEMSQFAQMATGMIDDAVQGQQGNPYQTAREFVGRREAAGTRLLLESRIYEETYLEPLFNQIISLNDQFLEPPYEYMILGDNANIDPDTGNPIQSTHALITGHDMMYHYMARAMGATTALSQNMRQSNVGTLLQYVTASPQMMGAINQVNFVRQILRIFEFQNVNELIEKQPGLKDIIRQATGGQGGAANVPTSGQMAQGQPLPGRPTVPAGLDQQTPQPA